MGEYPAGGYVEAGAGGGLEVAVVADRFEDYNYLLISLGWVGGRWKREGEEVSTVCDVNLGSGEIVAEFALIDDIISKGGGFAERVEVKCTRGGDFVF